MTFKEKYEKIVAKNNSLLCIGLDTDLDKIPQLLKSNSQTPIYDFNKAIIDTTHDLVCAYKPNLAFYEATAAKLGIKQLKQTCDYIRTNHPDIPIIIDAKRGDIGNTNQGYVKFIFDYLAADAVTLHPYLGKEALLPFLNRVEKGSIILCRTSNPGAGEFQHLNVILSEAKDPTTQPEPLYKYIAKKIVNDWNKNNNCMLVVGATYPEELNEIRKIAPNMIFLVPGIGTQGGSLEKTLRAGLNAQKSGLIISSSRTIIYASSNEDFAQKAKQEAQKLKDEINKYRL
jgi:orotidine-5'-phosphate decarboxylase